ncbi:flagellar hook-length control protein FliK [Metabacillus elymi]|uniref:Flagellar hook-length control protein FliK n=1 Tax=Metabacillus elymi TaxID=2745198 RepID=A0ABX6S678_9BACI|nr:flagellar hook-length control protein FliK [Metabacillus sp. KUDC1714]QNF29532.1 flagellar hook-length control protein FliK [Metabacillus sp. KUDC1714]
MKIAPLLQMMNQNVSSFRTIHNLGGSRFSEFLVGDQGIKQLPNIGQNKASTEDVSLQQITDELKAIIGGGSLDHVSKNTSFHENDHPIDTKSSTVSLLENQIISNFNDAESVKELIEQVIPSPTAVGVLTLVKAIEELPKDEKVDFSPFLSKLNDVLDQEYSSYHNANSFSLLSMTQAIDQMNENDKSLIEGEILLIKWTSDDDSTRLQTIDKLIEINNKLTEINIMPIQEPQIKKEIINDILTVPSDDEIKRNLRTIFEQVDLTTVKSIVNKTVENLFTAETPSNQLKQSVNYDDRFGEIRFFSEELIVKEDKQLERDKWNLSSESINQASNIESQHERVIDQIVPLDSIKTIEEVFQLVQSSLYLLSDQVGLDINDIEKEITSMINQYSLSKSIDHNSVNLVSLVNPNNAVNPENAVNPVNPEIPVIITQNEIKQTEHNTPLINQILTIATTADQVANKFTVDINTVLSEIDNLQKSNIGLTRPIIQASIHSNRTQDHDNVTNELIRPITPLIKGVQAFVNGIELSTQFSIDMNELYSKVEKSIQTLFSDNIQIGKKGTIFEEIPVIYDRLITKLSKQDWKFFREITDGMSSNIQELNSKINVQAERMNPSISRSDTTRLQTIDLTFSQLQPQEVAKTIEVREETFTIQLDKLTAKPIILSGENQKSEATTRQEFTNQLVNAFKTSKFSQLPNGANRLVIKLDPEHLGSLTVRLVQKNGEMVARIITSTESAKDLLDHSIHQLKQALPSIQIEIERFEVISEQVVKTYKDQNQEQEEKHEKDFENSRREEEPETEQSFIESLKEALNTTV